MLCLAVGSLLLLYYLYGYWRLSRQGYRVSPQKVCLLFSAGTASIWAWGFLPPFYAFFVSNFYHALQYFGIVWAMEKRSIQRAMRLESRAYGKLLAFVLFTVSLVAAGTAFQIWGNWSFRAGVALFTVVSLMHFWYDSFVWQAHKLKAS